MRTAALYDIHGNAPALEAVLNAVRAQRVDSIIIGGDVIPGPMPVECLELLRGLDIPVERLHGNGERAVLEIRDGIDTRLVPPAVIESVRWVASQLSDDLVEDIRRWPSTIRIAHKTHGDILFCHATPRNDTEIFTRNTPEDVLRPIFERAHAAVVVCGHTHMQFDRMIGNTRVMNAGSVGMPFGSPGAYWMLITNTEISLQRTRYDLEAAAATVRATKYPGAAVFAEKNVIAPPSEAFILEAYAKAEIGAQR
jgi:predicted phosphodiesterase